MRPVLGQVQVSFDTSQKIATGKWTIKNFKDIREQKFDSPFFGTDYYDLQWKIRMLLEKSEWGVLVNALLGGVPSIKAYCSATLALDTDFDTWEGWSYEKERDEAQEFSFGTMNEVLDKYLDSHGTLSVFFKIDYNDLAITDQYYIWSRLGTGRDLLTTINGKYTDVQFCIGAQVFKAHKVIITSRCRVFGAMLDSDTDEARTGIIKIQDIEPDVFRGLLEYLYTGWCRLPDMAFATSLLIAADRYNLTELMSICKNYIFRTVDKDNVVSVLITTDLIPSNVISDKCLRIIANNPRDEIPDFNALLFNPRVARLINECEVPYGPDPSDDATLE